MIKIQEVTNKGGDTIYPKTIVEAVDDLVFNSEYNKESNKVATMQDIYNAVLSAIQGAY